MKRHLVLLVLIVFVAGAIVGQDVTPIPTPARKRGWLSRILHPFSPNVVPQYKDPRLHGLALDLQITPQSVCSGGFLSAIIGDAHSAKVAGRAVSRRVDR